LYFVEVCEHYYDVNHTRIIIPAIIQLYIGIVSIYLRRILRNNIGMLPIHEVNNNIGMLPIHEVNNNIMLLYYDYRRLWIRVG